MVVPARATASIDVPPGCGAYILNAGQTAFFRVLYDQNNFDRIAAHFSTLDAADQLGILLDYWTFGRSGDAPFTDYLSLVATLPANADPVVASDTSASMASFADYERGRPAEADIRAYGRATLAPFFARVGWTPRAGEAPNDTLLRAHLITALGELGDQGVITEARRRVAASRRDASALPAAIRDATLTTFAYNASPADYETLLAQARAATDFVEQRRLWRTLANANDDALARRTLDLTLGDAIPRQLRQQVIGAVSGNHPRLAWDFLVAHRAAIEAYLEPPIRLSFPAAVASSSADPDMVRELDAYAANFPAGAHDTIASAEASIRARADTVNQRMPAVEAWVRAHPPH
jgi:aminopeptidase N